MGPLLVLKWQTPVQSCLNIYITFSSSQNVERCLVHRCLVIVLRQFSSDHVDCVCRCVHQQRKYKNGGLLLVRKYLVTTWIVQAGVLHLPGKVVQVSVRCYRNVGVVSLSVLEVPRRLHLYCNGVAGGKLLLVEVFFTVFP